MKARRFPGRYIWGAVSLLVLATVAVTGAVASPDRKDRGYMGIYMQTLTRDVREGLALEVKDGVLISGVEEGSPAAKAGIEDGDVIVEFNGKAVASPDDLRDMVGDSSPGEKATVVVIRDGDRKTIDLVVGERPDGLSFGWNDDDRPGTGGMRWFDGDGVAEFRTLLGGPRLGVTATELNDDLAGYFDAKAGGGVLVLGVEDGSVADKAGIKAGDVIEKVEDKSIAAVNDLREAVRDYDEGDEFSVAVLRKGKKQTLRATMDDQKEISFFRGDGGHFSVEKLKGHPGMKRFEGSPRVRVRVDTDDMKDDVHESLDELRKEIKQLKKEIKEMKKDR